MNVINIAETVVSILASSGIITIVVKLIAKRIEKRLETSYQLKLDKELEKYKDLLNRKNYISKTRFDAEFVMYQELSEKHISVVYDTGEAVLLMRMATAGEIEPNEISNHIERFCKDINDSEIMTKRYAPFIPNNMYEKFLEIDKKSTSIFNSFKIWNSFLLGSLPKSINFRSNNTIKRNITQKIVKEEIEKEQKELSCSWDILINSLRDYLSKLDVLEGK